MPPKRARPSEAVAKEEAVELPKRQEVRLPIHPQVTAELRSIHSKHPRPNVRAYPRAALKELRESAKEFAYARRTYVLDKNGAERDPEVEERVAQLGKETEKHVRKLIDLDYDLQFMKESLEEVSRLERERGNSDGVEPLAEYMKLMKQRRKEYKSRDLKGKYANVADYLDYRTLVHSVNDPTAPAPQKKDWFKKPLFEADAVAEITDEEPDSESTDDEPTAGRRGKPKAREIEDDDTDDDLQVVSTTKDLKCPLTYQIFVDPVKSTVCNHSYENGPIRDYIKSFKNQRKAAKCPVAGCGADVNLSDLQEDVVMQGLVEAMKRKEERDAHRALMGMDDDDDRRSKSKSKKQKPIQLEEEIPYDEEDEDEDPSPRFSKSKSKRSQPEEEIPYDEEEDDDEEMEGPRSKQKSKHSTRVTETPDEDEEMEDAPRSKPQSRRSAKSRISMDEDDEDEEMEEAPASRIQSRKSALKRSQTPEEDEDEEMEEAPPSKSHSKRSARRVEEEDDFSDE